MRTGALILSLISFVCGFLFGQGGGEFDPDQYTVALYHFNNDSSSNVLYDESGNDNHGNISGADFDNGGKFNKALLFDGSNDYVSIPSPNNLGLTNGYTIEAWIKPFAYGPNPGAGHAAFVISGPNHETYEFHIGKLSGVAHTRFLPTPGLNPWLDGDSAALNQWNHFAMQVDQNGTASLFVNGEFQTSQNIGSIPGASGNMNIGRRASDTSPHLHWNGLIDEMRISNNVRYTSSNSPNNLATFIPILSQMQTRRFFHTATLLQDGRVLITGGYNSSNVTLSTAEIFDPQTNTFSSVGNMNEARIRHLAILLNNGKVLIMGGTSTNNYPSEINKSTCELFDPTTGTFSYTGSLTEGRFWPHGNMTTLLSDGKVLVAGGTRDFPPNGDLASKTCEIYDPTTGLFSQIDLLHEPRAYTHMIALTSGEIIIPGGLQGTGNIGASHAYTSIERFNPNTLTWSLLPTQLTTGRAEAGISLLPSDSIFITGGKASSFTGASFFSTTEVITPSLNIVAGISLNHPRTFHEQTTLEDGRVLITGGRNGPQQFDIAELVDFSTNNISTLQMQTERSAHTSTLLSNGNILLVGGSSVLDAELFVFNSPPIASCQDMTVSAGPNCTADASINNGSFDPDGDPITLIQNPPGPYPLGSTEVTLTVADNNGATDQCTATVTVVDDTPPLVVTVSNPITLWPPNHNYTTIDVSQCIVSVSDNCANLSVSDVVITKVTSDEPEDVEGGGDGHTLNDIAIARDCGSVDLRQERQGDGNGRVYTIYLTVSDNDGNATTANCDVHVPHNRNDPAINDGIAYQVISSCNAFTKFPNNNNNVANQEMTPYSYSLSENFPNPFNPTTTIKYGLKESADVTLQVYNVLGQLVKTLVNEKQMAGFKEIQWDGTNKFGKQVSSGIYIYRIKANDFIRSRKMILMR